MAILDRRLPVADGTRAFAKVDSMGFGRVQIHMEHRFTMGSGLSFG